MEIIEFIKDSWLYLWSAAGLLLLAVIFSGITAYNKYKERKTVDKIYKLLMEKYINK